MVNNAVVIPSAIFATLAVCMFIFICWWFPRAWASGQASDIREYEQRLRMERELAARETGSDETHDLSNVGGDAGTVAKPQVVRSTYVPPAVTPY